MPRRSINLSDPEQKSIIDGKLPTSVIRKVKTARKKKSARYGKNKGASYQKQVASRIATLLGLSWNNKDDESPIATRPMGMSGVDIILRGEAKKRFPFAIECKAVESLSVPKTVEQAISNTGKGENWLIYWKHKSFKGSVVIMDVRTFENLYKK